MGVWRQVDGASTQLDDVAEFLRAQVDRVLQRQDGFPAIAESETVSCFEAQRELLQGRPVFLLQLGGGFCPFPSGRKGCRLPARNAGSDCCHPQRVLPVPGYIFRQREKSRIPAAPSSFHRQRLAQTFPARVKGKLAGRAPSDH